MKGGMQNLMRQAQQMQRKMEKLQEDLASITVEASSGGGMVTAIVTCQKKLTGLRIEKEVVDPNDIDMLQDLLVAAVNKAMELADERQKEEMNKIVPSGLASGFPGLF